MGIVATKTTEIHAALASGGRIVTLGSIPSLDRFQAQAIWEMSVYVIWKVRLTPRKIREMYRTRFGIETSYRQMHEARIKTCARDSRLRLLFVGIALVLRNVWVWLHFQLAVGKWSEEPQLFLELLRFREMLRWISQVIGGLLGDDQRQGIEYEAYRKLAANC